MIKECAHQQVTVEEYRSFLGEQRTVMLATVDDQGIPEASYAPFVVDAQWRFHLLLSDLARHSANLRGNGRVSLMFLADRVPRSNPFAVRRLTFSCRSRLLEPGDTLREQVMDRFEARFGGMIGLLRTLADFRLFELRALQGTYVRGFGDAWRISGEGLDRISLSRGVDGGNDGDH